MEWFIMFWDETRIWEHQQSRQNANGHQNKLIGDHLTKNSSFTHSPSRYPTRLLTKDYNANHCNKMSDQTDILWQKQSALKDESWEMQTKKITLEIAALPWQWFYNSSNAVWNLGFVFVARNFRYGNLVSLEKGGLLSHLVEIKLKAAVSSEHYQFFRFKFNSSRFDEGVEKKGDPCAYETFCSGGGCTCPGTRSEQ